MAEPAMREAYGDALLKMGEDERVVVLDADLAKAPVNLPPGIRSGFSIWESRSRI